MVEFRYTDPQGETATESYEYTEGDVRSIIAAELNLRDFSPVYVTRIETMDAKAGKYRFHLGASLQYDYVGYFQERNGSLQYMDAYMDVTLRDDELKELTLYVLAEGKTDTAKSHKYELKVTCTFSDQISAPAPI